MTENAIAKEIVDAAFHIHTALGPGLLESVYDAVLAVRANTLGAGFAVPSAFAGPYRSVWLIGGPERLFLTQPDESVFEGPASTAIQFFDFETRQTGRIADVKADILISMPGLTVSPDGQFLLYPQIDASSGDLILLDNFK